MIPNEFTLALLSAKIRKHAPGLRVELVPDASWSLARVNEFLDFCREKGVQSWSL